MAKQIITLDDILQASQTGAVSIPASPQGQIITAQAREKAEELGIALAVSTSADAAPSASAPGSVQDTVTEQVCTLIAQKVGSDVSSEDLRRVVGEVVAAKLGAAAPAPQAASTGQGQYTEAGEVYLVECDRLFDSAANSSDSKNRVFVAEGVNCGCAELVGGYMQWDNASIPRTMEQSEIAVVIEGELKLTCNGTTLTGRPGDMVYLTKGAQVEYEASSHVRLACVSAK